MMRASHALAQRRAAEPQSRPSFASVLPFATLTILVAGLAIGGLMSAFQLFSLATNRGQHTGSSAPVPGGVLHVNELIPEHMVPMQADKFASVGMTMSSMGMDMAPDGYRRFTVDITLVAEARSGVSYSPTDFVVSGSGVEAVAPLRHQLGSGFVPRGSAVSGSLVYQVPITASEVELRLGAGEPIRLILPPAADHGQHSTEAPATQDGHEHHGDESH